MRRSLGPRKFRRAGKRVMLALAGAVTLFGLVLIAAGSSHAVSARAMSIEAESSSPSSRATVGSAPAATGGQLAQAGNAPIPTGTVTRQGASLLLNGLPYHYVGFNLYQAN